MAIKTKQELVARLQSLQNEKLTPEVQLERMTNLLSDLVETTFSVLGEDRADMGAPKRVSGSSAMPAYESYATSYGLESGTTVATEVEGQLTINNVAQGSSGITMKDADASSLLSIINKGGKEVGYEGEGDLSFDSGGVSMLRIGASGTVITNSVNLIKVNDVNATGGGITLANDGEIVTLNDGYCSMKFGSGVRIYNEKGGTIPRITLDKDGNISAAGGQLTLGVPGGANGQASTVNFWSTFASGIADTGPRRTGTIKSRFKTGSWGNEVMSFHVGWAGGANDTNVEPTERATLDASGNFTTNGNVTAYSDARLKTNVKSFENGLGKVMRLQPVTYDRTDKNSSGEIGFLAQQVKDVEPNLVFGDEEIGHLSLDYSRMVVLLTKALQEQQLQIEELKQKTAGKQPA